MYWVKIESLSYTRGSCIFLETVGVKWLTRSTNCNTILHGIRYKASLWNIVYKCSKCTKYSTGWIFEICMEISQFEFVLHSKFVLLMHEKYWITRNTVAYHLLCWSENVEIYGNMLHMFAKKLFFKIRTVVVRSLLNSSILFKWIDIMLKKQENQLGLESEFH